MSTLYKATLKGTIETVAVENVLYFLTDTLNAQTMCDDLQAHWVSDCAQRQVNGFLWNKITCIEINHSLTDPDYFEKAINVAGVGGNFHSDPQLAVCVNLHTGLSGRRRRGRFFLAGTADEAVEGGKLTSTGQTDINAVITLLTSHHVTGTPAAKLQVFSRAYFSLLSNPFETSHKDVTSMIPNVVMSTIRSRKPA